MEINEDCISYIYRQIYNYKDHIRLSQTNRIYNKASYRRINIIPYLACKKLIERNIFIEVMSRYTICNIVRFPYTTIEDKNIRYMCQRQKNSIIHKVKFRFGDCECKILNIESKKIYDDVGTKYHCKSRTWIRALTRCRYSRHVEYMRHGEVYVLHIYPDLKYR